MKTLSQADVLEEIIEFVNTEIKPFAATFDENQSLPRELIKKMAAKGYLAAPFPAEYGGLGLDPVTYGRFTAEIGKACSSTRAMLTVHTSLVGETLLRWGTADMKNNIVPALASGDTLAAFALSEPNAGSDAGSIITRYERKGTSFVLNGKKKWITLAGIADLFLVFASSASGMTAFLVDRHSNGVIVSPMKGLLCNRASHVAEIEFRNVEVPLENMVGKEGSGFVYIANTALDFGRYSVAWGGLGIAQAAMEAMVSYSRERKQFGERISKYQFIQGMIADAVTKIHAARALCLHAGRLRNDKHEDAVMETTIAKYYSSIIANEIASDAVQVHGANGLCNQYTPERLFREAKILEIIEGTSQIQKEIIADFGLTRYHRAERQHKSISHSKS